MNRTRIATVTGSLGLVALMALGCGGGATPGSSGAAPAAAAAQAFHLRGNVVGLREGTTVGLTNSGAETIFATANGGFEFASTPSSGTPYSVVVSTQPQGMTCGVQDGIGAVASANVTNIRVNCAADPRAHYRVGGTASGLLPGTAMRLREGGNENIIIASNGAFAFPSARSDATAYDVSIAAQPDAETCTVANGLGTVVGADVTTLSVTCTVAYVRRSQIDGTVAGLTAGTSLVLLDDGGDPLTISANGRFAFSQPLPSGYAYAVVVSTQPVGETCNVANGVGTVGRANVSNIAVSCSGAATYSIGGTVTGLGAGNSVKLLDDNASPLTVPANGTFVFASQLPSGTAYSASVATQPAGESCTVSAGSGTVGAASVTNILVACTVIPSYTVGGSVSGLSSGNSIGLRDNGSSAVTISANGAFTFPTALVAGSAYAATVSAEPAGETCTLSGSTGTVASANISSIIVTCGVNPDNPVPSESVLVPASTSAGAPALTLIVTGSNFVAGSIVDWNGTALATTYTGASQLSAVVPAADLAAAATASITVVNPAPGGGTSTALPFSVTAVSAGAPAVRQVVTLTGGQAAAHGGLNAPWSVQMTVLQGSAIWVVGTVPIVDDPLGTGPYAYPDIYVSDGTNTYTLAARVNDPNYLSDAIEGTQGLISWAAVSVAAGTYTVSMLPGVGTNNYFEDWVAVAAVEITGVTHFDASGGNLQLQVPAGTNTAWASAVATSPASFLIAACFDDESSGTRPGTPAAGGGYTDQGAYWPLFTAGGKSLRIETLAVPNAGSQTAYFSPTEGADSQARYPNYLTLTAIFH